MRYLAQLTEKNYKKKKDQYSDAAFDITTIKDYNSTVTKQAPCSNHSPLLLATVAAVPRDQLSDINRVVNILWSIIGPEKQGGGGGYLPVQLFENVRGSLST